MREDLDFLLRVAARAESESAFEELPYEANRDIVLPWLKQFEGLIRQRIMESENADQDGVSVEKDNYEIWRFMIDKCYQGRGYGREALKHALDFIRTWPCGKAEFCWISYEPENEIARKSRSTTT